MKTKGLTIVCLGLLISVLMVSGISFALTQRAPEPAGEKPGVQGDLEKEIKKEDEPGKGGRGADIGVITAGEHAIVNNFLTRVEARSSLYTRRTIRGKFGELIKVQVIPNLFNPAEKRFAKGHYSIRGRINDNNRNIVFIYVDQGSSSNETIEHEISEYTALANRAVVDFFDGIPPTISQAQLYLAKAYLVEWLNAEGNEAQAKVLLQAVHDAVIEGTPLVLPEAIPDSSSSFESLGPRGAMREDAFASNQGIKLVAFTAEFAALQGDRVIAVVDSLRADQEAVIITPAGKTPSFSRGVMERITAGKITVIAVRPEILYRAFMPEGIMGIGLNIDQFKTAMEAGKVGV